MDLFQYGEYTLHSGNKSTWKIDCDSLADGDIRALARLLAQLAGPFEHVYGVPTGGLRLQRSLEPLRSGSGGCLLVDDVLTTGKSLTALKESLPFPTIRGAVIIARGPCPGWVTPLFQLHPNLWEGAL